MPEMWDESPGDVSAYSLPSDPKPPEKPAEETAEIANAEATTTLVEPEDNAEGRPRDEQGRFLPNEDAQPQVEGEGTPVSGELAAAVQRLIEEDPERYGGLAKFKTAEAVLRSYAHVEEHTGSLRNELGELRSVVEDRFEQMQTQAAQPQAQLDVDGLLARDDYATAAEMTWRAGNNEALKYVLASWNEAYPGAQNLWIENKQNAARIAQIEEQQKPILQTNEEQQRLNVVAQAYATLEKQYPDFEEHRPAMGVAAAELAARNGESYVDKMLNQGTPESVAEALEYLYLKARDRQGANLAEVSRELAREHVQNTNRAVNDAIVASATTTSGEAAKPSVADRIAESWAKADAPYAAGEDGWNV